MSKKDPTTQEAAEKGFDCSAFAISASVNPFYAVGAGPHDEHELGYPIACEERTPDECCRAQIPEALGGVSFRVEANERAKYASLKSGINTDALHIARGSEEPKCLFIGIHSLVSEHAMLLLKPHVEKECTFVETRLEGAKGRWFVLWVRNVVDVVDRERSRLEVFSWRPDGQELLRPNRLSFKPLDEVQFLFRLPQWRYFRDADLCTPRFVELVKNLGLTGFSWISAGGTGPYVRD